MPCSVKNPPAMQKIQAKWVQSLGREDPLEEDMATPCTPSTSTGDESHVSPLQPEISISAQEILHINVLCTLEILFRF